MRAVGIILAGGKNERLYPLTARRATSAIPVAASYRAIDFSLSNMSNSGITKIAVITQYNSRSLHDHMNSAKWWNIGRKQGGLFVFTPYMTNDNSGWFRGTADSMYQNISFLRRSHEEYVIIANGDGIYKMDYDKVLEQHMKNEADVTVVTKTFDEDIDTSAYGNIIVDNEGRIIEFEEKPLEKLSNTISIGVYVIKRELLIDMLEEVVRDGRYDFVTDVIIRYRKRLKMMNYNFDGYWKTLNSLENYYSINMDFLNLELRKELLYKEPYIYTKSKDEPPAKYNYTSRVCNSLVGNGTIINGNIEDSVIFRKVIAEKDSTIRNSVILEGAIIGNNCIVEHAIIDKNTILPAGTVINGTPDNIKVVSAKNFI